MSPAQPLLSHQYWPWMVSWPSVKVLPAGAVNTTEALTLPVPVWTKRPLA